MTSQLEFLRKCVEQFNEATGPILEACGPDASFSFFAIKKNEQFILIRGTCYLNVQKSEIPFGFFESAQVLFGHFKLRDIGQNLEAFIKSIFSGQITTPKGVLDFTPNDGGQYGGRFIPFHEAGLQTQRRLTMLTVFAGESRELVQQPELDWELRSSDTPYESLNEALSEYKPGVLTGVSTVDIAAFCVVDVDARSIVSDERAKLMVRRLISADPKKVTLGYRVIDKGKTIKRAKLGAADLSWTEENGIAIGSAEIDVPKAAIVQALPSYDGLAQHAYAFGDPSAFQNSRRAAYETVDPQFITMQETLEKAQKPRAPSRDFESVVSWLCWMLGFSPAHFGIVHTEATDIVMVTPNGHFAVVECCTGALDVSKLGKLHARTQAVRSALGKSGAQHFRVIPVFITALTLADVSAGVDQAEKAGIYLLTREAIDALIVRTLFLPNADQLFDDGERAIGDALQRHSQDTLFNSLNN